MVRSALLVLAFSLSAVSLPYAQDPLEDRLNAALAATTLRQAYFDANGEPPLALEQAFPHLAGAPLADPSFLAARRRILAAQTDARARERLEAGASESVARVRATCDAEDAASLLEERLLSLLTVGLELAPGFTAASIELARQPWRDARTRASRMEEDDPDLPEASGEALVASEAERRLLLYQASALRGMTLPGDPTLGRLVAGELAEPSELALDASAADRLRRALPLLGAELSRAVETRLQGAAATADNRDAQERADDLSTAAREATTSEQADILRSAAELRETALVRNADALDTIRALELQYSDLDAEFTQARALNILDAGRARRLQQVLNDANALVQSIRQQIQTLVVVRQGHDQELQQLSGELTAPGVSEAIAELQSAIDDRAANTRSEAEALLALEKQALVLRRAIAPFGSESITSQAFADELVDEIAGAPQWLENEWNEDLRWLRTVPQQATDLNEIGRLLSISFDLLLLALVWLYVRKQATKWLRRAVDATQKKDVSRFGFGQRHRYFADRELEPVARYATDAAGAYVLHRLLEPRTEILALVALVWVGWALLRCIPAAIRLLMPLAGRALDPLEADREVPAEVPALGESTSNWFLRWWIAFTVAAFVAVPLLQADRLLQLVNRLSWVVFFLLLVVALARWTPWIRQFIANLADQSSITVWLARPIRSRIQRMLRSAVGAVYIMLRLVFWALVDCGLLSRSGTSIAMSQLRLTDASSELLSPKEREQIRDTEVAPVERAEELDTLRKAFARWQRERRRGIVAVIGDHGMGKSTFLNQAVAVLGHAAPDVTITKMALPVRRRSDSLRERFAWLTEPLEITIPKNANRSAIQKTIVGHLESLSPRVFLVDDLHLLLRRTVGGFDVLEIARNIIQSCADEHFWVLTLHRPAWVYVDGVSSAMKLAFRERIELPALDVDRLGETLVDGARAAGFEPEFRSLLKGRRPHADKDTLEHKARRLYWRLVSQASLGNPRVVTDFWLRSLGATNGADGDNAKPVPVYLFSGHGNDEIESLSDDYLFLLTALVVHDGLKLEDLADVLNVTPSRVRVACQHLESLGIIDDTGRRYVVAAQWQPTIARVLDRRNFAHR